eukprot:TRINITY_DN74291_c0_g1_i1.p1 TRINITY_DN74291_c0_g1~~TRINITY_DN74291_c0_g1_i1.p1  ORF type:complete len:611 (+),score=65.88 TRINITY_DN74291_c0_g1_i1:242-1834(+)
MSPDIYAALMASHMHVDKMNYTCLLKVIPMVLSIGCLFMQVVATYSLQMHVERNMIHDLIVSVENELVMMAFTNKTTSKGVYESLCGTFELYNLDPPAVGSTAPLPGGAGVMSSLFFYAKMPEWTWDTRKLGYDKSLIDKHRFVLDEGFTDFEQGYLMLFMIVMTCFGLMVLIELRSILHLLNATLFAKTANTNSDAKVVSLNKEGKWEVHSIPYRAKMLGVMIALLRTAVCGYVGWEGVRFLIYTTEKVDLLLNALAVGFILEFDTMIFYALASKTQQNFIANLEPIRFKLSASPAFHRFLRYTTAPFLTIACLGCAFASRAWQIHIFNLMFNDAAALCLFTGPSPSTEIMAPVPGFCESIMQLTCTTEAVVPSQKDYCVITDFGVRWPKDVRHVSTESVWPEALFVGAAEGQDIWTWDGPYSGKTDPRLMAKFLGTKNYHTDLLERICLAMYKHGDPPRELEVDDDTGEQGVAAPFSCRKDSGLFAYFNDFEYTVTRNQLLDKRRNGRWLDLFTPDAKFSNVLSKCHV